MTSPAIAPGDAVSLRMSKWGDRPHWAFEARWLGTDEHGDWLGLAAGTRMTRPGAVYVAPVPQLVLAPLDGVVDAQRGWLATFHAPGGPLSVYVDITAPPEWRGRTLHAVDLDLDVLRDPRGETRVDDEDEFADHQVAFGYPPEVVEAAVASCAWVRSRVESALPPYDQATPESWFARLAALA